MSAPPQFAIDADVREANRSPCAKSKRGVFIWDPSSPGTRLDWSSGHNGQPAPFACDGSEACRNACSMLCEHAEQAAFRRLSTVRVGLDMLHVKTVDGVLVPSGGPSCPKCSLVILADGRVDGFWLFHADGWQRYPIVEFHEMTLATCGLPVLRGEG